MSGIEAGRVLFKYLNSFEKEEIKGFEVVYYVNLTSTRKAFVISNTVDAQVLVTDSQAPMVYNNGFDSDDGDFLYEAGDQINYRYEVLKKLGKGAFGVVIRCIDHKSPQKDHIALKILKNKKKLHK